MIRINTFIPVQHFLEELRQTRMRLLVESDRPHHRWSFLRSIQPGNMPIDLVLIRINQFVIGLFRLMIFVSRHYMKGCDMPRLHVVDPTTETGPGAELLNGPLKNKQINAFNGIANNADVLKALLDFSQGIKNSLSSAEHEVIALVIATKRHCEYCTAAHTVVAKSLGIDEEASYGIRQGNSTDTRQQALIDFTTAVIEADGFVTDEQFDSFKSAGFDDAAIVEVVAAIAFNTFTNLFNHVNDTVIDFPIPAQV